MQSAILCRCVSHQMGLVLLQRIAGNTISSNKKWHAWNVCRIITAAMHMYVGLCCNVVSWWIFTPGKDYAVNMARSFVWFGQSDQSSIYPWGWTDVENKTHAHTMYCRYKRCFLTFHGGMQADVHTFHWPIAKRMQIYSDACVVDTGRHR